MTPSAISPNDLPTVLRLATAYAPDRAKPLFVSFFAFDAQLARQVARAQEPILAQLPLSWWRDELGKAPASRAAHDPLLQALSSHWLGEESALIALVDGWEALCAALPNCSGVVAAFAGGRAAVGAAVARLSGQPDAAMASECAARRWALAELAGLSDNPAVSGEAMTAAKALGHEPSVLPRSLRPLAVLDGLARRSIARGGKPLLDGRSDFLAVMRLGMFGR